MGDTWLQYAFGYAPWVIFALIVLVAFVATRGGAKQPAKVGQTFACARCGRRGAAEQMVTVSHEGADTWYCSQCAGSSRSPSSA